MFRVNKSISDEASHFFYSRCQFVARDLPRCNELPGDYAYDYLESLSLNLRCSIDELDDFLRFIGPSNRQCIRRLTLEIEFEPTFDNNFRVHSKGPTRRILHLVKAFTMLSQDHNLRFVTLKFVWCSQLFAFASSEPLVTAFSKIRGLESLSIYSCEDKFPADDPMKCGCSCFEDDEDEDVIESVEKVQRLIRNAESKDDPLENQSIITFSGQKLLLEYPKKAHAEEGPDDS